MRAHLLIITIFFALNSCFLLADVDKVYHPYVEEQKYELELRAISLLQDDNAASYSLYRLGFGKDIIENLFVEFNFIGFKNSDSNFDIESYELEGLYQATEQGEYWLDFGMLFELKRTKDSHEWEGNFGLLLEKEYGRFSVTLNLQNELQVIDDVKHNWNFRQSMQIRYRYSAAFEPSIEIHASGRELYLGPVIMGQLKIGLDRLNWELGFFREIGVPESSNSIRAVVEYEF